LLICLPLWTLPTFFKNKKGWKIKNVKKRKKRNQNKKRKKNVFYIYVVLDGGLEYPPQGEVWDSMQPSPNYFSLFFSFRIAQFLTYIDFEFYGKIRGSTV